MALHLADEQDVEVDGAALGTLARVVLDREGFPESTEVWITLVDDAAIAEHNERFLGREGPTDVLAFPLEALSAGSPPSVRPGDPPLAIGDLVISPAYVRRQAEAHGVAFETEMALMVVHGMLHLLGYDHEEDGDAEVMERREREILGSVGLVRP